MKSEKPLALITNDDSIDSHFLHVLVEEASKFFEIIVCAPDEEKSWIGHAISRHQKLCPIEKNDAFPCTAYSLNGTPADCVKLAVNELLERKPDLCVSGVNHGSNSSINVIYSGTMSAALEAGIEGIPAIGFSLMDFRWNADFHPLKKFIKQITLEALLKGIPRDIVLNVNFPKLKEKEIKGIKICRQAKANWVEEFDKRTNPMGKEYYWLTGTFVNEDKGEDTDEWALEQGYVSIVPTQFDLTAHHSIQQLNTWNL